MLSYGSRSIVQEDRQAGRCFALKSEGGCCGVWCGRTYVNGLGVDVTEPELQDSMDFQAEEVRTILEVSYESRRGMYT